MSIKNMIEKDAEELRKFRLLPHWVRPIGWAGIVVASIVSVSLTLLKVDAPIAKEVFTSLVLLSMLAVSVSREKEEDEYLMQLRTQSYSLAFVIGVLYAVFQPVVNYGVAYLVKLGEGVAFEGMGGFVILWFMLFIQLGFYHVMKAAR